MLEGYSMVLVAFIVLLLCILMYLSKKKAKKTVSFDETKNKIYFV